MVVNENDYFFLKSHAYNTIYNSAIFFKIEKVLKNSFSIILTSGHRKDLPGISLISEGILKTERNKISKNDFFDLLPFLEKITIKQVLKIMLKGGISHALVPVKYYPMQQGLNKINYEIDFDKL